MANPRSASGGAPPEIAAAALPQPLRAVHQDAIDRSHERCSAFGLTRIERPDHSPLPRADLVLARERNRRLYQHAAPVMEVLFEQIVHTQSMIVLTDANGTILHSVGDDDFLARASKVALRPGANWAEHSKGTNAIGTALFEERPTLVHAGEHFMHANHFLTCSAVPIFDPRGAILGVLDVSGDHRSYHRHTMGLVRMSARMIENQWLNDDCSQRLRLQFHSRAECIGTLLEGTVVAGLDGKILGGNRGALEQLGLSGAALRGHSVTTLFGITVAALFDRFRAPHAAPMLVSLPSGAHFYLSARFDVEVRSSLAGLTANGADDPTADARAGPAAPTHGLPARAAPRAAPGCAPQPAAPAARGVTSALQELDCGDPRMKDIVKKAQRIVDRDIALLIVGEAGTGKEFLARALHRDSARAGRPCVGAAGPARASAVGSSFSHWFSIMRADIRTSPIVCRW
jgi:sigma-54 dependent transcriptional regulator, acetoin dehydrogenase operon transcriptional activator AcoR